MIYIDDLQALTKVILKINEEKIFAFDLEFIPENTFVPHLCLIQLLVDNNIYIIDPLKVQDLSKFWQVFCDNEIIKIVHSGKNDLEIIFGITNQKPENVFDIQVAACFCGYGFQLGLAKLLKDLLAVYISKSQTRSNWASRPLTQEQIIYAVNDVKYLFKLYEILLVKVKELQRLDWVLQESVKYDFYQSKKIPQVRNANGLELAKQYLLEKLAIIRFDYARTFNLPVKTVATDEALIELVSNKIGKLADLKKTHGLSPDFIIESGQPILEIINNSNIDLNMWKNNVKYFNKEKHLFLNELIYFMAKSTALKVNLPVEFLASRSDIEKLVFNFLQEDYNYSDNIIIKNWRKEILGDNIIKVLQGQTVKICLGEAGLNLDLKLFKNDV